MNQRQLPVHKSDEEKPKAEFKEIKFFNPENYNISDIVCGRSMISVLATYTEKQAHYLELGPIEPVVFPNSHRESENPAINIDEQLIKKPNKSRKKT